MESYRCIRTGNVCAMYIRVITRGFGPGSGFSWKKALGQMKLGARSRVLLSIIPWSSSVPVLYYMYMDVTIYHRYLISITRYRRWWRTLVSCMGARVMLINSCVAWLFEPCFLNLAVHNERRYATVKLVQLSNCAFHVRTVLALYDKVTRHSHSGHTLYRINSIWCSEAVWFRRDDLRRGPLAKPRLNAWSASRRIRIR